MCDRIEPWAAGTLVRATFIPGFWDFNLVRVEAPDPGIGARSIATVADDWLAELDHRRIEIEDEGLGTRLRAEFQEIGYSAERLLWMVREDGPPEPAVGMTVEEVDFEATRPLHEAWLVEEGIGLDTDFLDAEQRLAARRGMRVLAVIEDGAPVCYLRIVLDGARAEIDDVYCMPERRGSGLGSALLREALRRVTDAGATRIFIGADDDGRPKRLYARLGFRPAWVQHVFTRRP